MSHISKPKQKYYNNILFFQNIFIDVTYACNKREYHFFLFSQPSNKKEISAV